MSQKQQQQQQQQQQQHRLFPGTGQVLGGTEGLVELQGEQQGAKGGRSSSTGRGGGGGGERPRSRDHTPVVARYAVLQQQSPAGAGEQHQEAPPVVIHATVVEGMLGVTSANAGAGGGGDQQGRSSTPARLSRVMTPLKGRRQSSLLLGTAGLGAGAGAGAGARAGGGAGAGAGGGPLTLAALQAREEQQRQQEAAAAAAAAQRRLERRTSRRKLRRMANDRLVGVVPVCTINGLSGGGGAVLGGDDDENEHLPFHVFEPHSSTFTHLMAAENTEARQRYLNGLGGDAASSSSSSSKHGGGGGQHSRRPRTTIQEAELRFLRLERRLRSLLTQIVAKDPQMESFLAAVEELLRGFVQGEPLPAELPAALVHAMEGGGGGGDDEHEKKGKGESGSLVVEERRLSRNGTGTGSATVLVFPLKKQSAFLRLMVHGCCQFYGLKSQSQDVPGKEVRAVHVSKPASLLTKSSASSVHPELLGMTMVAFIRRGRLYPQPKKGGGRCLNEASEEERVAARAVTPVGGAAVGLEVLCK